MNEDQISPFLPEIYEKLEYLDRENLVKHFVSAEFNRYLSYYKNSRDINVSDHRKEGRNKKVRQDVSQKRKDNSFNGFLLNIGFRDQLKPARLIGLVNDCIGSKKAIIGSIKIMKNQSIIEIEERWSAQFQKGVKGKSFEDQKIKVQLVDKGKLSEDIKKVYKGGKRKDKKVRKNKYKSKGKWRKK